MSLSVSSDVYDVIEMVEDVLKDWNLYKLLVNDMGIFPGAERYRRTAYIMKCIEERKEYLTRDECIYLEMKYFKGNTYNEISRKLRISPRSVANWRIRIIYKIAKRGALI
mgnify:CR=1 FL=1